MKLGHFEGGKLKPRRSLAHKFPGAVSYGLPESGCPGRLISVDSLPVHRWNPSHASDYQIRVKVPRYILMT